MSSPSTILTQLESLDAKGEIQEILVMTESPTCWEKF